MPVAQGVADAFNQRGISSDGTANTDGSGADFDGSLYSYSATALSAAGWTPGKVFTFDGASFPAGDAAGLDNAVAVGQTVAFKGARPGRRLVFLGAANDGPSGGQALVTYTDGTSFTFPLSFDDWTLNGGRQTTHARIALSMTYRNGGDGERDSTKNYIFAVAVPLAAGKTVASVTLPRQVSVGKMHVFGMAVGS